MNRSRRTGFKQCNSIALKNTLNEIDFFLCIDIADGGCVVVVVAAR